MMCGVAVASLAAAAEAAARLSSPVTNVIVTAGGMGLAVAECGQPPQVHAAHAVNLVDTHGAGDTFIGALVARLVEGASLLEATRFANAAASLFVSTPADQKKSVTFDRVARFLSEYHSRILTAWHPNFIMKIGNSFDMTENDLKTAAQG